MLSLVALSLSLRVLRLLDSFTQCHESTAPCSDVVNVFLDFSAASSFLARLADILIALDRPRPAESLALQPQLG